MALAEKHHVVLQCQSLGLVPQLLPFIAVSDDPAHPILLPHAFQDAERRNQHIDPLDERQPCRTDDHLFIRRPH